jgi:4-hydroxybenzoate polyprenyltransferase
MSWSVALRLGRVSNLPTVWTNVLAALVLAGGSVLTLHTIPILLALSLFYVGGMYLNDAFDAEIDALERPERPIPAGQVSRATVFALGFAMLGGGVLILGAVGLVPAGGTDLLPALGGVLLGAAIVFYDWYHKARCSWGSAAFWSISRSDGAWPRPCRQPC